MTGSGNKSISHIFTIALSLSLIFAGFAILMASSGFPHMKSPTDAAVDVSIGVGLLFMMFGSRLLLGIFTPVPANADSLRHTKALSLACMVFALVLIGQGLYRL